MATGMKKWSFYGLVIFFVVAGLYHFINPEFYLPLIPDYLPYKGFINTASGILEVGLGLALLMPPWRQRSAYALIALMIAFIPAHVHFIQLGNCLPGGLCVPDWVGWTRLLVIHPLLMYWIYVNRS